MLSPHELERAQWGREFKRQIKTAAASREVYEDSEIAERVGVSRNAVQGWWRGAKPSADTLVRLARAMGIPAESLMRWVYDDGPPPLTATEPVPDPAGVEAIQRAASEHGRSRRPEPDHPRGRPRQ